MSNGALLRDSFALAIERESAITPRFYQILFERYPEVRPLFGHAAGARQQRMLQDALVAVIEHLDDPVWLGRTLRGLGAKHVDYGVTPEMYPWVSECLIAALAENVGPAWRPEHAKAWHEALAAVSDLMLEGAVRNSAAA
jgi:hemoglobin-like flavoprotein